jgi:putative metalloprotease
MKGWLRQFSFVLVGLSLFACAAETQSQTAGSQRQPQQTAQASREPREVGIPASQVQRLQQIMLPLVQNMDNKLPLNQIKVHIWDDPHINAANGGGGEFYVTTGLLQKANDDQLRAILAHEIAHADLGHVAKAQTLGAGLEIGAALLDQLLPGSGVVAPIAGQLIASSYSRSDERQADAHGVVLLRRAGYDGKTQMANALRWLTQVEGDSGGGFFATHPATADRIQAVQNLQ